MSQSILFRMKRFAVAPALMFALLSFAAQAEYEAGVHYFELPTPIAVSGDGIEVTEYFSYGCNHCYQFEPILAAWVKTLPEDVTFNRTPAMWNQGYTLLAQTYYTLLAMDLLETLHLEVFNAIHLKRQNIRSPQAMADYLAKVGVDPLAFVKVFNSFGVQSSLRQADARGRAYRATGVPTIIVHGKYRIETASAGSTQGMLKVAEYLIDLERQ